MEDDPFESLLGLEDSYYQEGFDLGVADGSAAGRTEGRIFGLEKGFEKFMTMGILHGRTTVWATRISSVIEEQGNVASKDTVGPISGVKIIGSGDSHPQTPQPSLPRLASNPRLEKHIKTLYELVEPASLSTQNTEEAVANFDDRLKRAGAKAKIVDKIICAERIDTLLNDERGSDNSTSQISRRERSQNMEDFGS